MTTGTDLGLPALFAHGDAAADHFVDIGQGEGDMVDARLAGPVEHEQVVVLALDLAAQEIAMPGIFVTQRETEAVDVKPPQRFDVLGKDHDMTDADGMRTFMDRRALI